MIAYLEEDELPEEERAAKKLIIESKSYEMIEEVLHHEHPTDPAKWCMVIPIVANLLSLLAGTCCSMHVPHPHHGLRPPQNSLIK